MTPAARVYWNLLRKDGPEKEERQPHKRATHAKVRTGCITCKNRRVKCDERTPICARCEKSGHTCTGYGDLDATKPLTSRAKKTVESVVRHRLRPKPLYASSIRAGPALISLDHSDVFYFEIFRHQIGRDLNLWTKTDLWDGCVMQESIRDDCVRHAVLAVAAMMLSQDQFDYKLSIRQDVSAAPKRWTPDPEIQNKHHRAAISHYTKAIAMCRQRLGAEKDLTSMAAMRPLIVATVAFVIFELVQGNVLAADHLLTTGLALLQKQFCRVRSIVNSLTTSHTTSRELFRSEKDLYAILGMYMHMSMMCGLSPFFPEQSRAEKEFIYAENIEMPLETAPVATVLAEWSRASQIKEYFMLVLKAGHTWQRDLQTEFDIVKRRGYFVPELLLWKERIEACWRNLRPDTPEYNVRQVKLARLHVRTMLLSFSCRHDPTDMVYDEHVADFRELLDLVRDHPKIRMRFTLDLTVFPAVCFVLLKCRDRETRQDALDLFAQMLCREGAYNNVGMIKGLRTLFDLEEQGRDENGVIPAWSRYRWEPAGWDASTRQMVAQLVPCVIRPGSKEYVVPHDIMMDF